MTEAAHTGHPLGTLLATPWRTTHASLHWLMLALMAGSLIAALAMGIHTDNARLWRVGMLLCCGSVGMAWAFWLSASALLAIDARRLRLPGVERNVVCALLLYGAITVGVPALLMGAFGADALQALLWLALAASGGLAFALLPRWCAMLMGFMPMLAGGLHQHGLLPSLHAPEGLAWGMAALAVLLVAIALRWRALLRSNGSKELGYGSAVVMQYRRQSMGNDWTGLQQMDSGQLIRQRPDWLQPRAVLRNAGPGAPVRALRIALGGQYLPKSLGSYLRGWVPAAFPLLLVPALMAFQSGGTVEHAIMNTVVQSVFGSMILFGGLGLAIGTSMLVRWRWRRVNAELPLLALLPGLGDVAARRRHLLRALFVFPASALGVLFAGMLVAAWLMHLHGLGLLLVALTPLAAAISMLASTLGTLGDRQLQRWGEWLYYLPLAALILCSLIVPVIALNSPPSEAVAHFEQATMLGWMAMALVMAWLAQRGWRAFITRPHPFLPATD